MAYVITQRCCNDASCVVECPVDCIRPRPEDPEFATTEMLYIDPDTCIDCGACVEACPVDAIFSEDDLLSSLQRYTKVNAEFFERHPLNNDVITPLTPPQRLSKELGQLRVAIVGTGPAACYAAEELLVRGDVQVEMFDRLPAPWGLVRSGVAPDHAETKGVADMFWSAFKRESLQFYLNVEVGKHISLAELQANHHAVIWAGGASSDRRLDIPGEDLDGSFSATEFVAWYNGHPDFAERTFDLSGERAVVVGNGNVALDVARILVMSLDELAKTDLADHALEALRESNIREVVVLGRRGPVQAAYSSSEFLALGYLHGVDIVIDDAELELDAASQAVLDDSEVEPSLKFKVELAREYARKTPNPANKRIVFRYLTSPTALTGDGKVAAVELVRNEMVDGAARATDQTETIEASLVLRSVGYKGLPVKDLPFDEKRAIIPNEAGRVVDTDGQRVTGVYTTGWIKRGPRGVIGTNRGCAQESVEALLEDFRSGALQAPSGDRAALQELVSGRQPDLIGKDQWRAIDMIERADGKAQGKPRVKRTSVIELLKAAQS